MFELINIVHLIHNFYSSYMKGVFVGNNMDEHDNYDALFLARFFSR